GFAASVTSYVWLAACRNGVAIIKSPKPHSSTTRSFAFTRCAGPSIHALGIKLNGELPRRGHLHAADAAGHQQHCLRAVALRRAQGVLSDRKRLLSLARVVAVELRPPAQ